MIFVIGMGVQGRESLSKRALDAVSKASMLVGGARHLAEFKGLKSESVAISGSLEKVASAIEAHLKKGRRTVAVLATGDPLLFGIATFLIKRFGKGRVEIMPNVSAVQEAFARIKESSNGLKVLSAHGRDIDLERLCEAIALNERVAVFTDPGNSPSKIAKALLERGVSGYKVFVCESLGAKDERVRELTLEETAKIRSFRPLNVMALIRDGSIAVRPSRPIGIPDELLSHAGGMITKEELRVISLAKLRIRHDSVVWDVGACSGSVAVEAASLTRGAVYAVEKEPERVKDIRANRERFGCENLEVIHGEAPQALKGLSQPDAVFIGGGGSGIKGIISYCARRLKSGGRLVVNAVTLETANAAFESVKRLGWDRELLLVNISKARSLGELSLLSAHNPLFIIKGVKP